MKHGSNSENSTIAKGGWSDWVVTGKHDSAWRATRLYVSGGEVRPRNMAIRIWKRAG
jgi:hypothetical protein